MVPSVFVFILLSPVWLTGLYIMFFPVTFKKLIVKDSNKWLRLLLLIRKDKKRDKIIQASSREVRWMGAGVFLVGLFIAFAIEVLVIFLKTFI